MGGSGGLSLILAVGNIPLELGRRTPTLSLMVLQAAMPLGVIMVSVSTLPPSCFSLPDLALLAPVEKAAPYRYSSRAFGGPVTVSVLTGSEIENVVSPRGVFMETKRKG